MAQRLAELEAQVRHRDEINRIREEQIRLLQQLLLLGGTGAAASNSEADPQRAELVKNLQ